MVEHNFKNFFTNDIFECKKDTNFMFKISIKKKIKQEKSSFLIWHISLLFHRYKSYLFLNKSFFYFSDIKLTYF